MKKENKKKDEPKEKSESFLDNKYQMLYMCLGMCFGMSIGMAVGSAVFDNLSVGMCMGMSLGMAIGIGIGASVDRKIAEQALCITDILEEDFGCEGVPDDAEVTVTLVLVDVSGNESRRKIPDRLAAERDLQIGDRIYFNENGSIEKYKRSENNERQ